MFTKLITLIILSSSHVMSGTLNIKLDPQDLSKMPASDLIYNGN